MCSNSEPQTLPPAMPHNQQAIERPERDCRLHEQVHRDLRSPSLSARLPTPVAKKAGSVPTHERLGPASPRTQYRPWKNDRDPRGDSWPTRSTGARDRKPPLQTRARDRPVRGRQVKASCGAGQAPSDIRPKRRRSSWKSASVCRCFSPAPAGARFAQRAVRQRRSRNSPARPVL
jgi:hypothetical protein